MVDHQSLLGGHARNEKARECWLGTSHRYDLRHAQMCMASAPMCTACETEMPPLRDLCTRQSTCKGWDDSRRSSKPQRVKDMMYSEHKSACAAMPRPIFFMRRHGPTDGLAVTPKPIGTSACAGSADHACTRQRAPFPASFSTTTPAFRGAPSVIRRRWASR